MKAILEFDLDDYHERLAHRRTISANDCYLAFHDILGDLERSINYPNDQNCNKFEKETYTVKQLENLLEYIRDVLAYRQINMDDLE